MNRRKGDGARTQSLTPFFQNLIQVLEWNLAQSEQGNAGIWDSHIRLGGFDGTDLEAATSPRDEIPGDKNRACFTAFHITKTASFVGSNVWCWAADHDLDYGSRSQISISAGRGILIESTSPVWLWGQSTEHFLLYQMCIHQAKNVLIGMLQTETPYFSGSKCPPATDLQPIALPSDPTFNDSKDPNFNKGYGLLIKDSHSICVLGAGLYSFFDSYTQECIQARTCQRRILGIESREREESGRGEDQVSILGINTIGTTIMLDLNGDDVIPEQENRNGFTSTVGAFVWRN